MKQVFVQYKKLIVCFAFLLCAVYSSFFLSSQVLAQTAGDIAKDTFENNFVSGTGVQNVSLGAAIAASVTIILGILGTIFFLLAVYAGFIWTTAEGESEKIESAKQTIIRATIGFMVVVSSYALSSFVVNQLKPGTGTNGGGAGQPEGPQNAPIACCLDLVSATGRPGPVGRGVWTDRMATKYDCSVAGEDMQDPGDVRYGAGTWEWLPNIPSDAVDECEAARLEKVRQSRE